MKRRRFTETQIVSMLKEADAGKKVKDATYYNWKSKYGGMSASELKRLKETEPELSQYKRMYAELARENFALKDLIEKALRPLEKRGAAQCLVAHPELGKVRACAAVRLSRSSWYRPVPALEQRDRELMDALNGLFEKHPLWGF